MSAGLSTSWKIPSPMGRMMDSILSGEWQVASVMQPIVDLQRGRVTGYEALARFPKEVGLPPDRALLVAEQLGKRYELEALLLAGALRRKSELPENCFLSVNVSPTFMLSSHWEKTLSDFPRLERIVVEITEEQEIEDYDAIRREIERVHRAGGTIAIDDTGAGYASLKHVMELRPDFIKIDRLFVGGCHLDATKRQMLELLGSTADHLDSWVIAEGIETEEELCEVQRLGIPLGQGYFLGRPTAEMLPLEPECAALLKARRQLISGPISVGSHVEMCSVNYSLEEALEMLTADSNKAAAIVVDGWGRPQELVERHPLLGIRSLSGISRVQGVSSPSEVLPRMLNRPPAERFDPVAIVDELGTFCGLLRIERLAEVALEETVLLTRAAATEMILKDAQLQK